MVNLVVITKISRWPKHHSPAFLAQKSNYLLSLFKWSNVLERISLFPEMSIWMEETSQSSKHPIWNRMFLTISWLGQTQIPFVYIHNPSVLHCRREIVNNLPHWWEEKVFSWWEKSQSVWLSHESPTSPVWLRFQHPDINKFHSLTDIYLSLDLL